MTVISSIMRLAVSTALLSSLAHAQEIFMGQSLSGNGAKIVGNFSVDSNEVVYLCDCHNGAGDGSSEMAYYSDFHNSRGGQAPEAIAIVTSSRLAKWDDHTISGRFSDGTIFSVWDLNPNVARAGSTGQAQIDQSLFQCWSEGSTEQYASADRVCSRVYSCAHRPPWASLAPNNGSEARLSTVSGRPNPVAPITDKAKIAASQEKIHVSSAVQGMQVQVSSMMTNLSSSWEVYHNIWSSRNNIGCSDQSFDVGNGCSISFDCTWPDDGWVTANSVASFLDTNFGTSIHSAIVKVPDQHECNWGTCQPDAEPPFKGPPPCCWVKSPSYTVYEFPQTVRIHMYNEDDSLRGWLYATITCITPPACNALACRILTAAIGLLPVPGSDIIGKIASLGCEKCS